MECIAFKLYGYIWYTCSWNIAESGIKHQNQIKSIKSNLMIVKNVDIFNKKYSDYLLLQQEHD